LLPATVTRVLRRDRRWSTQPTNLGAEAAEAAEATAVEMVDDLAMAAAAAAGLAASVAGASKAMGVGTCRAVLPHTVE
tara:strand:- start:1823 stop:2056 length:234 start_codon:yes stop_codon:yes gene_type:complete